MIGRSRVNSCRRATPCQSHLYQDMNSHFWIDLPVLIWLAPLQRLIMTLDERIRRKLFQEALLFVTLEVKVKAMNGDREPTEPEKGGARP